MENDDEHGPLAYRLCPRCQRAVPISSPERYCSNDGALLIGACPECRTPIGSPFARFCAACGHDLFGPGTTKAL